MLLLRLTLAPLLVAAATLAAQKWGPRVGGLLLGLPLTTGPIFLLLAIDQGLHFPAGATVGVLLGLVGLAAFAVTYAAASSKTGWVASLASATVAFFAFSAGARRLGSDVVIAGLAAWLALVLAASLLRRPGLGIAGAAPPWWDLWVRMLAVAALTLAITTAAARLGPILKRDRRDLPDCDYRSDRVYSPSIWPQYRGGYALGLRPVVDLLCELLSGDRPFA
jgi:hypothetical protein